MKKKMIKKLISCFLAATFVTGALVGCGNNTTDVGNVPSQETTPTTSENTPVGENQEPAELSYPVDTDVTLTIAVVPDQKVTNIYENYGDAPFYKQLQERTGIKIEFVHAADEKALELMLMSGDDMPDMIWGTANMLPGGAQICIEDGIILSLNDYLDDYMPDYKALLESDDNYRKMATTASGDVWGCFHAGETFAQLQSCGLMVRQDWLDELGIEPPRTAEQFYDMLVAFKEKKGAEVPLSNTLTDIKDHVLKYIIPDAFGLVSSGYYHIDGEVHYGYAEPEIKDVFSFMKKLYDDGLLDPEFATLDEATEKSNILTGRSGALYLLTGSVDGYRDSQEDPNFWLCGLSPLVQNEGDVARGGVGNGLAKSGAFIITSSCEHPEIAAMLLNYGYSEEGEMFYNFGTEGETWTYNEQGEPIYTELIMKNPDGLSYANAVGTMAHGNYPGPFIQTERYYHQAMSVSEHRLAAWEKFTVTDWDKHVVPTNLAIPTECQDEYAKIKSEVETFIDEMIVAYITGAKSLDNFESEFTGVLKSMKIDRMIEIYQLAYDAYVK